MKKILKIIREYWSAIKIYFLIIRNKEKNANHNRLLHVIKLTKEQTITKFARNAIAAFVKTRKTPYEINQEFIRAKEAFLEFQKLNPINDASLVKPGDYVTIIASEFPVKGERYAEYYFDGHWFHKGQTTFRVDEISLEFNSLKSENFYGGYDARQCRFATKQEIEEFIEKEIEEEILESTKHLIRFK